LNHLLVDGDSDWGGGSSDYALWNTQSTNTVVNDSALHANGPTAPTVFSRVSDLTLNRTLVLGAITRGNPAISVRAENLAGSSSLTLDSSVVALGSVGVQVDATSTNSTANATIRNSTIDPDLPKDTAAPGVVATQNIATSSTTIGIDSSIVVGAVTSSPNTGGGTGTMTCTNTDVSDSVHSAPNAISCGTVPGNPGGNSTTAPALLFEAGGFLGLGWHLLPTAPAIDTGAVGALSGGQSTTDLDGNPRLLDGNADCVARRDKGAYEVTGQAGCPPPPGTTAPGTSSPQTTAPARKKCKKGRKLRHGKCVKKKRR
jgi:hypothetical protein